MLREGKTSRRNKFFERFRTKKKAINVYKIDVYHHHKTTFMKKNGDKHTLKSFSSFQIVFFFVMIWSIVI